MKSKALLFAGFCAFALCASPVQATNREPAPLYYNEVDNPANNWVSVDYTLPVGEDKAHMKILNAQGATVAHYDLQGNKAQKTLDLRGFTPGVYVYSVSCGKYFHTGKLVIVK